MALKIASIGSAKHRNLKHQAACLLALESLWGQCVPSLLLSGELSLLRHGFGLGAALVHGRHPKSGLAVPIRQHACHLVLHADQLICVCVCTYRYS